MSRIKSFSPTSALSFLNSEFRLPIRIAALGGLRNFSFIFFLAILQTLPLDCGTAVQSIQREYSDAAFAANFDHTKNYRLAVLPVNPSGLKISSSELNSLNDFISLELLKTRRFSLIERNRIEDILNEQEFGISGIVDVSTAAKIGKVLGAEVVMLIEITELKKDDFFPDEDAYDAKVFVRMIDVATAEILFYGKGRGGSMSGKVSAVEMAISNATKSLHGGLK